MLLLNRNRIKKNLSLEGNSSGKLKKSGSNSSQLMSEWSIKQGARQRRPRYREIMILDHIQDMKTLQGRGWLIIFLYLSYQFKISSELEILWDRLLEVCVAVYTWILWELSIVGWNETSACLHTCQTNTWFLLPEYHSHAITNRNWDFCSMCEPPKKGCGTWDIALMEFILTYFERDKKGKVEAEEHSNDICWSQITRHCQTIWWIIPPESRLPSEYRRKQLGLWPVGLKRIKCTSQYKGTPTKLKFNGAE